jgi:hypothetical protein
MIARLVALAVLALAPLGVEELLPAGPATMKDGLPTGWESRVGATTAGRTETSQAEAHPEGGVVLRGDGTTGQWRVLVRPFPVKEREGVRITFEARTDGLRLEKGQFDNAWVGAALPLPGGKTTDRRTVAVADGTWTAEEMVLRPAAGGTAEAWIFLAKTGSLAVRAMKVEPLRPEDSYDALVRHMGRYYSHLATRGAAFAKEAAARRDAVLAAKDEKGFVEGVTALLATLGDMHVFVRPSDGSIVPTHRHHPPANFDLRAVRSALADPVLHGRMALTGTAGDGFGYLGVFSLPQKEEEFAPVLAALEGMLDRRGMIVDLRACTGGNETRARAAAAFFAKAPVVYARTRVRGGPAPGDLSKPVDRVLEPRAGRRFAGPVVVLLGPLCASSGEGFAAMMAAIPGAVTMGRPTAGFSGNPQPVDLPNGVSVHFSRWVSLLPDGTPLEGRGVVPARVVEAAGPGDPAFEEALKVLGELAAKPR